MALSKIQAESMNLADTFAFTGTVSGAGETSIAFKVRRRNNAGSQTQLSGSDIFKTGQTNGQITVDYNLGNHFSNGRFTCPSDGLYQFTVIGLICGTSGAVFGGNITFLAYFTKNGETNSDAIDDVQIYTYNQSGNAGGYPYLNYTDTYQLSANDVVGFRIQLAGFYASNSAYYDAKFMGRKL
tara:strand:- start:3074 stop:3622 length:549 start_codon:yes stop_codon:yes gene_type:complete